MVIKHRKRRFSPFVVVFLCALALAFSTGTLVAQEPDGNETYIPPSQGATDAPIYMIEFGDFQ